MLYYSFDPATCLICLEFLGRLIIAFLSAVSSINLFPSFSLTNLSMVFLSNGLSIYRFIRDIFCQVNYIYQRIRVYSSVHWTMEFICM